MQIKLKTGKAVDLTEDEIKEILHDYKAWSENKFDAEKLEKYFEDMYKKACMNVEMISEEDIMTEKDLKDALTKVMKYGTASDIADFIVEAIEMKTSYMILESMGE